MFSDSFCQFLSNLSDGSQYVTNNPQLLHKFFGKKCSLFLQIHMENTLLVKTTASPITTTRPVFLPACKYHIILLGNTEGLPKKLHTFCFTYQHADCLCTLFKYRFSGKVNSKSGQVFDNVQRAVDFDHRNKGLGRMPSIAKKRLLKKVQKALNQLLSKDKDNADRWFSVCRKNRKC